MTQDDVSKCCVTSLCYVPFESLPACPLCEGRGRLPWENTENKITRLMRELGAAIDELKDERDDAGYAALGESL